MQIVLNCAALLLSCYAVWLLFNSNFNMGNLMVWMLAALMDVYAIWHKPINGWFATGFGRGLGAVLAIGAAIYLGVLLFICCTGHTVTANGREPVMIVLGAGLRQDKPSLLLRCRLDKAFDYASQHPDLLVITSGGQGKDEWLAEGDAMRSYLIEKGLTPERVLSENRSTSTEENFLFSLEIMKKHGFSTETPIVYVTNTFHIYRGGQYAKMAGFSEVHSLPAPNPVRSWLPNHLREVLALLYYWFFRTSTSGPMHAMVGILSLSKRTFTK